MAESALAGALAGGGAPPAGGDPGATPPPAGGTPPPASGNDNWYKDASPDITNYITTKAWDSPLRAVESYKQLESVMGAERAGKTLLVLPDDKSTPEQREEFLNKLGRPAKPEEYKWADESNPELAKAFAPELHKLGLTGTQQQGIEKIYNDLLKADVEKYDQEFSTKSTNELNSLKTEMGNQYDDQLELAKRAVKTMELNPDELTAIERVIGTKRFMSSMMKLGAPYREANPPPAGGPGAFVQSKQQAQARIAELKGDPTFQERFLSPNNAIRMKAIGEMEELQKVLAG